MFFKIVLFVFLLSGNVYAQTAAEAETNGGGQPVQKEKEVDLNAPAPAASVKIRIPHSERTKGNLMDAAFDFLLMRAFKSFDDMEITYDFFETDSNFDLNFKNFKVNVKRPDAQGKIGVQKIKINFSDFMEFLKSRKVVTSKLALEKLSVDLKLIEQKEGQKTESGRRLKMSADEVTLQNVFLFFLKNEAGDGKESDVETATGKNVKVTLSDPAEKYAASSVELKNVVLPDDVSGKIKISSAKAGGKEYKDLPSFLRAIRQ